ncbi:MAG TPA: helicase-exonuclease AddAB subunit AddB [Firmicutes bacterium]|jgi:ATP-dependent helicase/nuclease subunit B|nr:helicase-exonuclease AddAB subunit AddB [Candidatus Fermentithermobacillaceae bacterium]
MGLRFIIGPAGSGKTRYIIDSVIEGLLRDGPGMPDSAALAAGPSGVLSGVLSRPPVLIIVPDQATFQMEKAILEDGRISGFMNLQVLGFRRLCLKVLDETGGITQPFITPVGRSMAVQSILWEHKEQLSVYAPMVNYPGFREEVIQALSEFNAYDVSPGDLEIVAAGGEERPPFLSQKLRDLQLIYRKYTEFLQDNFLDPDDYLKLAVESIPRSDLLRNAVVWIDGFSGFTPREYQVIGAMLKTATQVNLALCMDREEIQHPPRETSLFHPVREVYETALALCRENGVPLEDAVILGQDGALPRFKHRELACLEAAFRSKDRGPWQVFEPPADCLNPEGIPVAPGGVQLISTVNLQAEVEFAAREILRLVREQGLRFKDITVELRDLQKYKDLIEMVFTDHDIPFFLDLKSSLSHHPLAELVRSAFDIILTDFGFDAVFRYLKTDLVPLDRELVDELENYVLACGIRGKRWLDEEPWQYAMQFLAEDEEQPGAQADNQRIDAIRREAMSAFSRFYAMIRNAGELTAEGISLALYDLLMDLGVQETLARWQEECQERGDLISVMEHAGIWDKVLEILEQAAEILGPRPCDVETYALLINAGLEDMRLGAIPPSLDQVLVGSLDRTRQPECRVTFLLGASEGDFPMKHGERGVFTDEERETLLKAGVNLEPSSRLRQLHEEYLVYIALTRPRDALYISYPLGDNDGKAMFPSPVVQWVKSTMPYKETRFISTDPPGTYPEDLDYLAAATVRGVAARRLSLMRQGISPGVVWEEVYRWMLDPCRVQQSRKILSSLGFTNKLERLGETLSHTLYGYPLVTSISRLERFQQCPFRHFAADGLGLKQRQVFKLDPLKTGSFFHEAMREFVREVSVCEQEVARMEQEDVLEIMDQVVGKLVPRIQDRLFLSSFRYQYVSNSLGALLRSSARVFLEHARRGDFRPLAVEVPFGLPGGVTPYSVRVPGHGEVLLRGRIDRVDFARLGSRAYLRVVDYKSSRSKLDLLEVYYGLSLQLLVYLGVAVSKWDELVEWSALFPAHMDQLEDPARVVPYPAGAVYLPIHDPFLKEHGPLDREEAWLKRKKKNLKMAGLLLEDMDVLKLMDTAASGYSDILPVHFTKAGGVGSNSSTVAETDLELLLDYVEHKVGQISADIISGRIDIMPFRRNQQIACTYCEFSPLCTFDVLVDGNEYNTLSNLSRAQIWEEIRSICRGGE